MSNTQLHISKDPIVIYDGSCGMCSSFVQFILKHEKNDSLRFTPMHSDYAMSITEEHFSHEVPDSIIFVDTSNVYIDSTAAIEISKSLRWPYSIIQYFGIIPRPIRDAIYRIIAKYRKRIFDSSPEACEINASFMDRVIL